MWNFYSNWLFVNMLKSWDSFEKNGCFESETTLKMNLIKWADSGPEPGVVCGQIILPWAPSSLARPLAEEWGLNHNLPE